MIKVVKGIYKKKSLRLLESLNLSDGQMVKVIVTDLDEEKSKKAKDRQLKLLNKGFKMGKVMVANRIEIHER